ncbi:MAG: hypothetical protein HY319_06700 [Armatimonadetes bacterium]|nr:hypothetical protein [Armatimonadota bacterium]
MDTLRPTKQRLRTIFEAVAEAEALTPELLASAVDALDRLCDVPRELPRVARLKYEGEGLLRTLTEGWAPRPTMQEWIGRLGRYLQHA